MEKQKKDQSSHNQKCHSGISPAAFDGINIRCFIFEKSRIKDNPGIGLKIYFRGQKMFVETIYLKL